MRQFVGQALEAIREGDLVRALALLDQVVAEAPDDPDGRWLRAEVLLAQGSPEEAVEEARRALKTDPRHAKAERVVAWGAWQLGRLGLAQQSFESACDHAPGDAEVRGEYARFMAMERGPKLAEEAALAALRADPESPTAWAALGQAQYRQHRMKDSRRSVARALELDAEHVYAQWVMTHVLLAQGKERQAEALVDLMPKGPETEQFAQSVHKQANRRRAFRRLYEREAGQLVLQGAKKRDFTGLVAAVLVGTLAAAGVLIWLTGGVGLVSLLLVVPVLLGLHRMQRRISD